MTREKRKPKRPEDASRRWVEHATYGRVPLVRHTSTVAGKTYEGWHYDPSFKPKLPRGAVEGDVSRQTFVPGTRRSISTSTRSGATSAASGSHFRARAEFTGTRRFNFRSAPDPLCAVPPERRSGRWPGAGRAAARAGGPDPRDPAGHLALARALIELRERTGTGRLETAIAAARKAARLWRGSAEAAELERRARRDLAERR